MRARKLKGVGVPPDSHPLKWHSSGSRSLPTYSVGGTSRLSMMCTVALPTVMFEHTTVAAPSLILSDPSASTENVSSPPWTDTWVPAAARSAAASD